MMSLVKLVMIVNGYSGMSNGMLYYGNVIFNTGHYQTIYAVCTF